MARMGTTILSQNGSLKVIDQLTYADPSTGWVTMAAGLAIGTGGAYLGDQAVEEIFGGERFPVIAGQGTRPGSAVAQDGGHLLSGSWQFASGIKVGRPLTSLVSALQLERDHTAGVLAKSAAGTAGSRSSQSSAVMTTPQPHSAI